MKGEAINRRNNAFDGSQNQYLSRSEVMERLSPQFIAAMVKAG
jgi:hypothetical protein